MGKFAHKLEELGLRHGLATNPRLRPASEITNYGSTSRIATPICETVGFRGNLVFPMAEVYR
jgi:hypothetical protein